MAVQQLGPAPSDPLDAATKAYVDTAIAAIPPASGGSTGLTESGTYPNLYTITGNVGGVSPTTPATTDTAGIVELADNTETVTGTDATRATTPAGVSAAIAAGVKSPQGTADGQIQYYNAGNFAGATNALIEGGNLRIVTQATEPTAPAVGGIKVHAQSVGGRDMLRWVDSFGFDTSVQPFFGRQRIRMTTPLNNSTTLNSFGIALSAIGTATAAVPTSANAYTASSKVEYLVTTAATTAIAGARSATLEFFRGGGATDFGGFHMVFRWGHATGVTNTSHTFFAGMQSDSTLPTAVQPSTLLNAIGVGYDSATANYSWLINNGSGTGTYTSTGIARPTVDRTTVCELMLYAPTNNTTNVYASFKNLTTGEEASTTLTGTKLPSAGSMLSPRVWAGAGGVSSVMGIAVMSLYIETDN